MLLGPPELGDEPAVVEITARRYLCTGCGDVMVVVSAGTRPRFRYRLGAIVAAVGLWWQGLSAAEVRCQISPFAVVGEDARRGWHSLCRWTRQLAGWLGLSGLDSVTLRRQVPGHRHERRRWQAARPHQIWHADVMHGPAMQIGGRSVPLRIHAILDDCTRYVVAIQACTTERESEMLALLLKAFRGHGGTDTLYLDNGSTYVGETLRVACARLGIALVHAKPYDPQARGKMERLWRTLRQQCVSVMGPMASLHDVQVRLIAWLDRHYHRAPHAGLLGRSPEDVMDEELLSDQRDPISEQMLREALTVRQTRRLRSDGTVDIAGKTFELKESFMAGQRVVIARTLANPTDAPWVEHEGQRLPLRPVDPVANSRRGRDKRAKRGLDTIPFDPPGAWLRALTKPEADPNE